MAPDNNQVPESLTGIKLLLNSPKAGPKTFKHVETAVKDDQKSKPVVIKTKVSTNELKAETNINEIVASMVLL